MTATRDSVLYSPRFYDGQAAGSRSSAAVVVPMIVDLTKPKSVLDVGCGVGPWLAEFSAAGVQNCHGIDGPWVDKRRFCLGPGRFTAFDFNTAATPFKPALPRDRFDLVVTLEFLEHVRPDAAKPLVDLLSSLSDTVLMSAALPGQGGTNHVNEQWIDYWAALFQTHGYQPLDFLRFLIWDDERISPWYRQNLMFFFRGSPPPDLVAAAEASALDQLRAPRRLVHPGVFSIPRKRDPLAPVKQFVKKVIGRA